MVNMQFVDSTNVEAIGYDDATNELHIRFKSSPATYVYTGVPQQVFEELQLAESKGRYVDQNIKPVYKQFYKL
jgi:hypothetical protein